MDAKLLLCIDGHVTVGVLPQHLQLPADAEQAIFRLASRRGLIARQGQPDQHKALSLADHSGDPGRAFPPGSLAALAIRKACGDMEEWVQSFCPGASVELVTIKTMEGTGAGGYL